MDQKERVLKNIRSALKSKGKMKFKAGDEDEIFDGLSDFTEIIAASLREGYGPVMRTMGKRAEKLVSNLGASVQFDFSDPRVSRFIRQRAQSVAGVVNEETLSMLRDEIAFLFAQGGDLSQVSEGVSAFFDGMASWRSMRIARTETGAAANQALDATWQQNSDVVIGKEWLTARDESVRESHLIDGQIVPIEAEFVLGSGETAPYPQGPGLSAGESINCRCSTAPVIGRES